MKRSVILTVFSLLVLGQISLAQVPQTISYQGVLKDASGNLLDDAYDLTFNLYDAGGTVVWSEGVKLVPVSQGVFSVVLGNDPLAGPLPDPFPSPAWLGISVAGGAELSPRVELTAVPYALNAAGVSGASNVFPGSGSVGIGTTTPDARLNIAVDPGTDPLHVSSSGAFKLLLTDNSQGVDQKNWQILHAGSNLSFGTLNDALTTSTPLMTILRSGSVGIGTNSPAENLHLVGSSGSTGSFATGSDLLIDSGGSQRFITMRGPNSGQTGILFSNSDSFLDGGLRYFPDATAGSERLEIFSGGSVRLSVKGDGNVGIGTTSPSQKLDVNGTVLANGFALNNLNTKISSLTTNNIDLITNNAVRVRIDPSGNVGIGTTSPGPYKLYVVGDTYTTGTGWFTNGTQSISDRHWKKNITTLSGSLDKVLKLRGVSYEWRTDEFKEMNFDEGTRIGVIAQEVEEVLPELVNTSEDGYKAVAYDKLTAVLIEAVKELKAEKDALERRVAALETTLAGKAGSVTTVAAEVP